VVITVIGALAGLFGALASPKTYSAVTAVNVFDTSAATTGSGSSSARTNSGVNLDTEAQIVTSVGIATAAAKNLETTTTPRELAKKVSVTVPPNSTILDIAFHARKAEAAQAGSLAIAQAYLANRNATAASALAAQVAAIDAKLAPLQTALQTATNEIATLPQASAAFRLAEAQQGLLISQIDGLHNALAPLATTSTVGGVIITEPAIPSAPISPSKPLYLGGGLLVGLLLGLLAAGGAERLDTRLKGRRSVERALGLPVLAAVPLSRGDGPEALVTPRSPAANTFVELRNKVASPAAGTGTLLIAAVNEADLGAIAAVSLAVAVARSDGQAAVVTTTAAVAATTLIGASYEWTEAEEDGIQFGAAAEVPGLTVVNLPLEDGLLTRAENILAGLQEQVSTIVVQSAAVLDGPTAQALAAHVDAVILVVRDGSTRAGDAQAALAQFEAVGARVLGVVTLPRRLHLAASGAPQPTSVVVVNPGASKAALEDVEPEAADA
jgi:capsular polysaccharide biosynthesis protein